MHTPPPMRTQETTFHPCSFPTFYGELPYQHDDGTYTSFLGIDGYGMTDVLNPFRFYTFFREEHPGHNLDKITIKGPRE